MTQPEILIVEDNPGDRRLIQEALREALHGKSVFCVNDGEAALKYLRCEGEYAMAMKPRMVILDLNLPRRDGREVLSIIKADPDLRRIPVVILTSSRSDGDISQCYAAHANCYVAKPADVDQFFLAVQAIRQFWLATVELPVNCLQYSSTGV